MHLILNKTASWTVKDVEDRKDRIRLTIDEYEDLHGAETRLDFIKARVGELDGGDDPINSLDRFIFIVHGLVHHLRMGGLSAVEIQKSLELAQTILTLNGIKPQRSRLAGLYGELHIIKSQLALGKGDIWAGCWQQQIALHISGENPPGGLSFQSLLMGRKAQRLGHTSIALTCFEEAEEAAAKNGERHQEIIRIERIRCLRLAARCSEAKELVESEVLGFSEGYDKERAWENQMLAIQEEGDLDGIFSLCFEKKSHFSRTYVLESYLWSLSVRSSKWQKKINKVRTMARNKNLDLKRDKSMLKACLVLENAYETDTPFLSRLDQVEKVLTEIRRLKTLDKELLVWLATARWLARSNHYRLSLLILEEYKCLSLRISQGLTNDALGVAGDIIGKEWQQKITMAKLGKASSD
ncbi:MAG: hypothetical protein CMP10_14735 [Zetaproteobacteria bacterium]|nr:hypothetical protein [Pseudobdellovibrionaceae bacterium]